MYSAFFQITRSIQNLKNRTRYSIPENRKDGRDGTLSSKNARLFLRYSQALTENTQKPRLRGPLLKEVSTVQYHVLALSSKFMD